MSISFKGYGENVLTFKSEVSEAGVPVIVTADCVVRAAAADKDFIGIACEVNGDVAGVIMDGYVEMTFTGNTPAYGYCHLVADGSGGVKAAASGTASDHIVRVLKIDTENNIVGFIL